MDLKAEYDAIDARVEMTADRQEAMFLFLQRQGGWVGVTLAASDLAQVRDRISQILGDQVPLVPPR